MQTHQVIVLAVSYPLFSVDPLLGQDLPEYQAEAAHQNINAVWWGRLPARTAPRPPNPPESSQSHGRTSSRVFKAKSGVHLTQIAGQSTMMQVIFENAATSPWWSSPEDVSRQANPSCPLPHLWRLQQEGLYATGINASQALESRLWIQAGSMGRGRGGRGEQAMSPCT